MKKLISIVLLWVPFSIFAQKELHTENVVIITLDGLRWQELYSGADPMLIQDKDYVKDPKTLVSDFWHEDPIKRRTILMPFFWSTIAKEGQLYGNRSYGNNANCSNQMWFSYPGYSEILTGFADDSHIRSNDKIPNPNKTVLEYLHEKEAFKGKVAVFGSWDVFPFIINEERSGIPVNAGFEQVTGENLTDREKLINEMQTQLRSPWASVRWDAMTHQLAMEHIKKKKPRILYISYGETDDFAHDGKYDDYLRSANQTDRLIAQLWSYLQSDTQYKNKTTLIITTDHGRGTTPKDAWRSHGKKIKGSDQIWFAAIGPDTEALGEIKQKAQYYQNQIAKTAVAFLGIDYQNEKKVGSIIKSMISIDLISER